MIGQDRACTIESYQDRVLCGNRSWTSVDTIAADGYGPGEFRRPGRLVALPGGELVVQGRGGRVVVFGNDLDVLLTRNLHGGLFSTQHVDGRIIAGLRSVWDAPDEGVVANLVLYDLESGEVLEERRLEAEIPDPPVSPMNVLRAGALGADGATTFWITGGDRLRLVRFTSGGDMEGFFSSPDYDAEPPSSRDIDEFAEGARALGGGQPAPQRTLDEFAERPRVGLQNGRMVHDDSERLWVALWKDRVDQSHLDVFDGTEHVRRVSVDDRLQDFDINGSTLVALVETDEPDGTGGYLRRLHWYEIEG